MARMLYCEAAPNPEIEHAVDCRWSVRIIPEGTGTPTHWVLPDGCYSLAVDVRRPGSVHVRAPVLRPFRAPCLHDEEIVGIRFRPGVVPNVALPGIRRKLRSGQTAEEITAVLQYAVRLHVPEPEPRVDRMVSLVRAELGRLPVSAIADTVQLSARQIERLSLRTLGLSPKEFTRVSRLQAVVRRLIAKPQTTLADCAAEFGFTDQTHMTREFSTLGHITPAAWLRMVRDVGFVLESGCHSG